MRRALILPVWSVLTLLILSAALPQATAQPQGGFTPIPAIQGAGSASPRQGERVNTFGVVTGRLDDGFYLQDLLGDGNPATSDGIFVYTYSPPPVEVGDCVSVYGATVEEFYAKTELNRADAITPAAGCGAVAPVALPWVRPGQAAPAIWEAYEGMLVHVAGEMVVQGPAKHFAGGEWEIGVMAAAFQQQLGPGHLFHDTLVDGEAAAAGLLFLSNQLGATLPAASWSDRLTTTAPQVGILDYNFGKYQLLVAPGQTLGHLPAADFTVPEPRVPERPDEYSVCSFNLHGMGRGSAQYADAEAYSQALRARARVIAEQLGGCTLVALQETGTPEDAAALAAALGTAHGLAYAAVALDGPLSADDEFPLTNSFLLRSDRVQLVASEAIQACAAQDYGLFAPGACAAGRYPVFDRPPLAIQVRIDGPWSAPQTIWLINNHWKSKSGDEAANARLRAAQAGAVADYAAALLRADPGAQLIVLGDLNDFYQGEAVSLLTGSDGPGLINLHAYVPPLARYTYIFNGAAQVLDHVLVTPGLATQLADLRVLHSQADIAMSTDPSSPRVSDHDPIYVRLRPGGAAALAGSTGIGGVVVTAQPTQPVSASVAMQTTSDASGEVRLWGLAPGSVTLEVTLPDYAQFVDAPAGDGQPFIVELAPGVQRVDLPQARHRTARNGARLALATHALVARLVTTQATQPVAP